MTEILEKWDLTQLAAIFQQAGLIALGYYDNPPAELKDDLTVVTAADKEIEKVVLFGSRARQDNKYNSDIDLCLFGENITHLIQAKVTMDIEEINTPLSFDILNFNELTKNNYIKQIGENYHE